MASDQAARILFNLSFVRSLTKKCDSDVDVIRADSRLVQGNCMQYLETGYVFYVLLPAILEYTLKREPPSSILHPQLAHSSFTRHPFEREGTSWASTSSLRCAYTYPHLVPLDHRIHNNDFAYPFLISKPVRSRISNARNF